MKNLYQNAKTYVLKAVLASVVLATVVFTTAGCVETNPILPSWDVVLDAAVLDTSYTLYDVIKKDSSVLKQYNDPSRLGLLYYSDTKKITPVKVEDKLQLAPIGTSVTQAIGSISISSPSAVSNSISLQQIFSGAPTSGTFIYPPIAGTTVSQKLPRITQFRSATFESGQLNLAITNNNGVSITITSVAFKDGRTGVQLSGMSQGSSTVIPQGQTGNVTFNLTGVTLPDSLQLDMGLSSPGSNLQPVSIPSNAGTSFSSSFTAFSLSQVTAVLPAQNPISVNNSFTLDASSQIRQIIIDRGSLTFTLRNSLPNSMTVSFRVDNLKQPNGNSFTQSITLGARGTADSVKTISISDLHDYQIVGTGGNLTNSLSFSATITPQATASAVTLRKTDEVQVGVNASTLVLKSVSGKIKPTQLNFKSTSIPIQLNSLEGFTASSIKFDKFITELLVKSSPTIPLKFAGKMTGKNSRSTATITIDSTVLDGVEKKIVLNQAQLETFINTFISAPPDSLILDYTAIVNPNFQDGSIANTDSITGSSYIELPLKVGVGGGQFTDTSEVNVGAGNSAQLDNLLSAQITLKISNGIPAGLAFKAKMYDSSGAYLMDFPPARPDNPDSMRIEGAPINSTTGAVLGVTNNSISFNLTTEEFKKFSRAKKLVFGVRITTTPPTSVPVEFRTNEAIKLFGFGLIKYRVKQ